MRDPTLTVTRYYCTYSNVTAFFVALLAIGNTKPDGWTSVVERKQ